LNLRCAMSHVLGCSVLITGEGELLCSLAAHFMPLAQSCHPGLPQSSAIQFPAATDRYHIIHHVCVEHLIVSSAPGALSLAAAVNDAKVHRVYLAARRARCDPSADPHQYRADAAHKYARRKCCSRCVPLVYFAPHLFTPLPRQTSAHSPKKLTLRAATRRRTTLMVQPCAAHTFPSCCLTDPPPPLAADQAVVVPQASKKKRNK
jgi:hypothetical protein